MSNSTVPVGPGLSRLPLLSTSILPVGGRRSDAAPVGRKGSSASSSTSRSYGSGTEKWPYSISRVANSSSQQINNIAGSPVTAKPYRLTGKLWMRFGTDWYVCTASLVKKAVLITAAHCVHKFGTKADGWADEVLWYPANTSSKGGPWGYYAGTNWRVPTPYFDGTDTCENGAAGIACNNDIATVTLQKKSGEYPGTTLGGWYGYGWNGYSFAASPVFGNSTVADITQLGYPVAFDSGYQMQMTDTFGKYITSSSTTNGNELRNTQIGSPQTGGSSGGPWLVNFGTRPSISTAADLGSAAKSNYVVGVTSWGYSTVGANVQGASWFGVNAEFPDADYGGYGAGNIGNLMRDTCSAFPAAC